MEKEELWFTVFAYSLDQTLKCYHFCETYLKEVKKDLGDKGLVQLRVGESFLKKDLSDKGVVQFRAVEIGEKLGEEVPLDSEFFSVNNRIYMVGGYYESEVEHESPCIFDNKVWYVHKHTTLSHEPTNSLWFIGMPPFIRLPSWNHPDILMNSKRSNPMLAPLRDGKIFICGGSDVRECWAEIYDHLTQKFKGIDLPDNVVKYNPHPSSCFLWNQRVMIHYYCSTDFKDEPKMSTLDRENMKPSLLSYDLRTGEWEFFANNLPGPSYLMEKRNLVYVGGDILFIIDHAFHWFVYDLYKRRVVGNVKVEGEGDSKDRGVAGAFYVGDNETESSSWVIYLFRPHCDYSYSTLRYVKVEVVQGMHGAYETTVQMSGVLDLDPYGRSIM